MLMQSLMLSSVLLLNAPPASEPEAHPAQAQAPVEEVVQRDPAFHVFEVTTDLQRKLLRIQQGGPAVVTFIDGDPIINGSTIDVAALDPMGLFQQLQTLSDQKSSTAFFKIRVSSGGMGSKEEASGDMLWWALEGLARRAGYKYARPETEYTSKARTVSWNDIIESAKASVATVKPGPETPITWRFGTLQPVQTTLSAVLTHNIACFVDLDVPLTSLTVDRVIAEITDDLRAALKRGKIDPHGVLSFKIRQERGDPAGNDNMEIVKPFMELYKILGFDGGSVIMHRVEPSGPFKPYAAPDFTLRMLDTGEDQSFHTMIDGKVSLLVFWGVSCGPCRAEAPHLTRLYEKYKNRGFTVVAVNGYNEPADQVRRYIEGNDLTHPVMLMGRDVARNQFKVSAYPTTLLINRKGQVISRSVGFGGEKTVEALEQRIDRLLGSH